MSLVSAALTSLAVLVWRPPWGWVRVRVGGASVPHPGRRTGALVLVLTLVTSVVLFPLPMAVIAWTAAGVAGTVWHRVAGARRRRVTEAVRDEAHRVVDALVAELRSGAPPATAILRLAPETALL
ncbi:hypothetical protein, partial [Microbacterium sp.]|uniref:hypothetical protein n=1 Tax=Microbacterium sp. TaxID=51671 RepID=UPI0028AC2EF5